MIRFEATETVLHRAKTNPFRTFKFKNTARAESTGAYRMRAGDYCMVAHNPKFHISAKANVFTMGSCFAREIETALLELDIGLVGMDLNIPPELLALSRERLAKSDQLEAAGMYVPTARAVVNQYTPASMAAEIAAAFTDESADTPPGLLSLPDGNAYDLRHHGMSIGPRDLVVKARRSIDQANRTLRQRGGSGKLHSWDRWIFRATSA